ncbi:HalOD1 output domain-containing protein [Natronomonas halophila]|uniref:HalOD1 output domain-containing protein n=1 Tax=Natronomonas halophila TaxID=2747817 RepID=UPI001BA71024|nr:HalOD1 output domain-containing protein [Natronomonas halophila]
MTLLPELTAAVADAKDKEPEELEIVLEDQISTEAIRRLDDHEDDSWVLQFELPNHAVQIEGDGAIIVDGTQKRTFA